ncbi:MAG TPA: cell division protein FtsA, partial [Armatimonadota bacterium]|nr:cell division protein FtsA [Armatimonadota bacterium]
MAKSEIIVGLDVGTTKVCAVVGEVTKNGVELSGHGISPCQGLQKGIVVDIDATVLAIEEAIEMAQQATGFQIRSVAVGITGQHIQSFNSRGSIEIERFRDITAEDVEQAKEAAQRIDIPAGREIIHSIPRAFRIDGHEGVRRPIGMTGTHLEVEMHIVTAETSFLQNLIKCVHQADLSIIPGGIILEPLATAEAVLSAEERELGVALVDIGGGTSDVALFRGGGVFHTSVIPVGGNHVTNDLAVGLRVARNEAERIKLEHGTALDEGIEELEAITVTPLGQPADETVRIPKR